MSIPSPLTPAAFPSWPPVASFCRPSGPPPTPWPIGGGGAQETEQGEGPESEFSICHWKRSVLGEVSQRRRNIIWHPLCVESKKKWYTWTYLQNRKRLTDLDKELMVAGWKGQGVWDGHVHAAIFKMDNQQVLLYIAYGTLINVTWQLGWEGSLGENGYMYMDGWVSQLFTWN